MYTCLAVLLHGSILFLGVLKWFLSLTTQNAEECWVVEALEQIVGTAKQSPIS